MRRCRPIVLTAAAAVLAMIPLSRSVFWGPMAVAIMGGLIVATALTLFSLPAMYAAWFRVKRRAGKLAGFPGKSLEGRKRPAVLRHPPARVAKLVDAPGLGPDAFTGVWVRVPPRAPATL